MDAWVQLALMAKAKLVFESADTFLSFPALSPPTYTPDRLKFGIPSNVTAQSLADLSEFSRITNQIPRGVLAPIEEGEYFWEVYHEVLRTAQLSSGSLSATDKVRYEEAIAFLYTKAPDGSRKDSDALTAYKQYRDAVFEAQEDYKNQQLTAEASTDAAVQAQWRTEEEPRLRAEVNRLEEEWVSRGFKVRVEAAQQVEQACAAGAPSMIWDDWKGSFIDDLDVATDASLISFAPTGFSPYDMVDVGSWPRFTLTRAEMIRLVQQAPSELLNVFGSSQAETAIECVSFEYRSVALTRSWLRPALFKSRFWRLPAGAEPLSAGSDPPQGRCPSYVTALVFARNVSVQARQQQGAPPIPPVAPPSLFTLDPALHPARTNVVPGRLGSVLTTASPVGVPARPLAAVQMRAAPVGAAAIAAQPTGVRPVTVHAMPPQKAAVRLQTTSFPGLLPPKRPPTTGPVQPPTGPTTMPPTNDITVLAFICKRLPRCPDPDPALAWL